MHLNFFGGFFFKQMSGGVYRMFLTSSVRGRETHFVPARDKISTTHTILYTECAKPEMLSRASCVMFIKRKSDPLSFSLFLFRQFVHIYLLCVCVCIPRGKMRIPTNEKKETTIQIYIEEIRDYIRNFLICHFEKKKDCFFLK